MPDRPIANAMASAIASAIANALANAMANRWRCDSTSTGTSTGYISTAAAAQSMVKFVFNQTSVTCASRLIGRTR